MVINWYTVMFQVINFMVLVFLLRRFLYGPITNMMKEREMKILQREEEAANKSRQADHKVDEYEQELMRLKERDEELLEKAKAAAEDERQILIKKISHEADQMRQEWKKEIYREQKSFTDELRRRIGQQACEIARHCLKDLADHNLEIMIYTIFLKKIKDLSIEEKNKLEENSLEKISVCLSSSFQVSEDILQEFSIFLEDYFNKEISLTHVIKSNLICGMEIEANGYSVGWNVTRYVEDVEKKILSHLSAYQKEDQKNEGSEF